MAFNEYLSKKENEKLQQYTTEYYEAAQKGEDDILLRYMALYQVVNLMVLNIRHAKDKKRIKPGMVSLLCSVAQDGASLATHVYWLVQDYMKDQFKIKVTKRKRS